MNRRKKLLLLFCLRCCGDLREKVCNARCGDRKIGCRKSRRGRVEKMQVNLALAFPEKANDGLGVIYRGS
jgi:hypothetical protein